MAATPTLSGVNVEALQKCNNAFTVQPSMCVRRLMQVFDIWWEAPPRSANFSGLFQKSSGLVFYLVQSTFTAKQGLLSLLL